MRIITDLTRKIKLAIEDSREWVLIYEKPLYQSLLLVTIALLAFGLGRLGQLNALDTPFYLERQVLPLKLDGEAGSGTNPLAEEAPTTEVKVPSVSGQIVASRNSTKYHLPWCPGAKSIKPENRVYFLTEAEAIASGRSKAGNCK